ncbi:BACON domain-containing protein [[Hallella] seregens]|uniref:BACON domain-containing protein n=1 Tax=Hallella seregens ATCC 51272 TaxID=1336250 RepID=A0ABV5ZIB2_9BACT|nr:BACON domain-containing protein [Hallella seregens]
MKIKHIIPALFGLLAMLTGCSDDYVKDALGNLQVSKSYVTIPVKGGADTITVTATGDWTLEKVVSKDDSLKWLGISKVAGAAGETELVFSAAAEPGGRAGEVLLHCNGQTQHLNIQQGVVKPADVTCAEVIAGPNNKSYRVTGICTGISNTVYGNWYLTDATGQIYIYGTLDAKKAEKNFASLGIEVGDEITVTGPKKTYGTTVELVNVTVEKINKSLIKVDSTEVAGTVGNTLPLEGGELVAHLTCKGQGVSVGIPEDAKEWLSISSIKQSGTTATVIFKVAANAGGDRTTTITFSTTDGKKEYSSTAELVQKGAIVAATVAEFNAAPVGNTMYRLTGVISKVDDAAKGRFHIKDFSGETYVYGFPNFPATGAKEGDIVTLVGKRGQYKEVIEMLTPTLEKLQAVAEVSVAEFLTKADDLNVYYKVSGKVANIKNTTYGNFDLESGDAKVYVYGCMPGYGATGDAKKNFLTTAGIAEGNEITMIGYKTTYKGTIQMGGGFFFSKK